MWENAPAMYITHIKVTGVIVIPFRGSNLWFGTP